MSIEAAALRESLMARLWTGPVLPVAIVAFVIVAFWYVAAIAMNAGLQQSAFANADRTDYSTAEFISGTLSQERPRLPAPHQIIAELYHSVLGMSVTSRRSLVYHGAITVQATLAGFLVGALMGLLLAISIVHVPSLERSLMPWLVASQAIPIIALAPMIVVIFNQFDLTGLVPKAVISAYLSFFPVAVGMAKGLRAPDVLQLDLMRTYSATAAETLIKLRMPASVPFLFASLKVGVAASLVGAIVAEMTKSEDGGFGARLLAGSYYGQTIQIWAALFAASVCACGLIGLVALTERLVARRMGMVT
jgi:NitT/TauT family transport system permease protein